MGIPFAQILGMGESAGNTIAQGIGGLFSAGSQIMGQAILGNQIPQTNRRMTEVSDWGRQATSDAITGAQGRINERSTDAANWNARDANGDAISDQGRQYAGFQQKQGQDAQRFDADAKAAVDSARAGVAYAQQIAGELVGIGKQQIADVMSSVSNANAAFEGDRLATLTAFKDDVAAKMSAFRGANDNLISTAMQKVQESLSANGSLDDPLARLQAEAQVKSAYSDQLGRQMTTFNADNADRLMKTHLALTAERTKLFESTAAAKNAAFGTAGQNIANAGATMSRARELEAGTLERLTVARGDFSDRQNIHGMEAYKAMSEDARETAKFRNANDMWGAQMEANNVATTASNLLMTENLTFQGWMGVADKVTNMTWSVPQSNMSDTMLAFQMANSSSQDSGGSFSVGIPGIASYNS